MESVGVRLTTLWNEILFRQPSSTISELWKEHLNIRQELDSLKLYENPKWKHPKDRLIKVPAFLKWAQKMGIEYKEGIEVKLYTNGGLGLITNEKQYVGKVAISVPQNALLSVDCAAKIETLKKILDKDEMLNAMENVALAMTVAHEFLRKEESEWAAYIDILPAEFQTPIFYNVEEFQSLKPSPVFESALLMFRQISRQFVYFYLRILGDVGEKGKKHLTNSNCTHPFLGSPFAPRNFTFDFYRWCVSVVSTRINMVPSQLTRNENGTPKEIPALIPLIDFANHAHIDTEPIPGWLTCSPESNCVEMQLNSDFIPGDELCIYYGKRTNAKFLLHNGFVPKSPNPDDFYELKIGLPTSSPNFLAKVDCLKRKDIMPMVEQQQSFVYLFLLPPNPTEDIIRSSLWNFALIFVSNSSDELTDDSKLNSAKNKQKARKFLSDRFRLLIRAYGEKKIEEHEDEKDPIKLAINRLKNGEQQLLTDYLVFFP